MADAHTQGSLAAGDAAGPASGANPARTGRWVVLGLVGLGLVAAAAAWVWNYQRSRRALAFFGPQTALLIRRAPTVELVLLQRPLAADESAPDQARFVAIAGQAWVIQARIDLSRTPGLLNARTSLLQDASFRDEPPRTYHGPLPPTMLRYAAGSEEAWVGLDLQSGVVIVPARSLAMPLVPKTAAGWRDFLQRQLQNHSAMPPHDPLPKDPQTNRPTILDGCRAQAT